MKQRIVSLFTLENLKYYLLFAFLLRYNVFSFAPEGFKFIKLTIYSVHSIGLAWGGAILIRSYLNAKPLITLKPILPLLLFLISYFVTILTTEFGALSLLPGFFSYILYFFVLASYDSSETEDDIFRQIRKFNNFYIFATFIIAIISLTFFFIGNNITFAPYVTIGTFGGRFSGITGNANKDAILAALSIFCTFFNFSQFKLHFKTKFFYSANAFAQIFLLAIGFSRGSALFIVILILLLAALWTREQKITSENTIKILTTPLTAAASIIVFLGLLKSIPLGLDIIKNTTSQPQAMAAAGKLDRPATSEVSNGRIELWKTCSKVALEYPLGVGFSNIKVACQKITSSYDNNINSMHNTYLQALVGSGIFGLLTTLAFTLLLAYRIWKTLRNISSYKLSHRSMLYFCTAILISLVAYSTYENGPFFIHNIPNMFFWTYLGFFSYFANSQKEKA